MSTINQFCDKSCIDFRHNTTFITLMPNKNHIQTIKDCRPICILTSVYKILSKALATRLKLVMNKRVSRFKTKIKQTWTYLQDLLREGI